MINLRHKPICGKLMVRKQLQHTATSSESKTEFEEFSTEDVSVLEEEVKKLDAEYGHNNIRVIADVEYSVSVDVVEEQLSTGDSIDGDTDATENNYSESLE